ncbi:MAG TPA: hypothetical protein VHV57_17810 [Acidimicrobiales bacterium]|nr:hypothetical protein [Acidimicrobiales bacterium]
MSIGLAARSPLTHTVEVPAQAPDPPGRTDRWTSRLIGRRGLQLALGWLWLLDALLQLEAPNFARDFPLGDLAQSVMGAPGWENRAVFSSISPFVAHWPWWNLASALLQGTIGIALIIGFRVRGALLVSILWSATIWLIGEGLGMLPTGFAMALFGAPGAAVLYGALAGLAWPGKDGRYTRPVARRSWVACWSIYWMGAAVLQLPFVYATGQVFRAGFQESSSGQRSFLARASHGSADLVLRHPATAAAVLGLVELSVAVGWLLDRHNPRRWLGLGIGISVVFWVVGQGLGGVLNWGATDPGTAPSIILLALAAWPRRTPRPRSQPSAVARPLLPVSTPSNSALAPN